MRKSEAKSMLIRFMREQTDNLFQDMMLSGFAEDILDFCVEKIGLLPPEIPEPNWRQSYPENDFINEWEPEDNEI